MPRTFAETLSFLLRYREQSAADVADLMRDYGVPGATAEWLDGLATGVVLPSPAEQQALAQALRVPLDYFADSHTTALTDAVLVLAATLRDRNVQVIGPCRCGPVSTQDYLALYATLLLE